MSNKYEITNIPITPGATNLWRIRALKTFGKVLKGEVGGFVEHADNLSQEGNCWIGGDAQASGNSMLVENAQMFGKAQAQDTVFMGGNSKAYESALLVEHAQLMNDVEVFGSSHIQGLLSGRAKVGGHVTLQPDSLVTGNVILEFIGNVSTHFKAVDNAILRGHINFLGVYAFFGDDIKVHGNVTIDNSVIGEGAELYGTASITGCKLGGTVKVHGTAALVNQILMGSENISS